LKILNRKLTGVIHCFTGSWEEAEKYLALGFYLGLNGIIFKLDLKEVIEKTPLDKILVETDCPYLTPPAAGTERNEPIFVKYIIEEIAKIKNIGLEEVADITTQNAIKLFNLDSGSL
jgi:TatD DNase family protein